MFYSDLKEIYFIKIIPTTGSHSLIINQIFYHYLTKISTPSRRQNRTLHTIEELRSIFTAAVIGNSVYLGFF